MKDHKYTTVINVAFYVFAAFKIDALMLQLTELNRCIDTIRLSLIDSTYIFNYHPRAFGDELSIKTAHFCTNLTKFREAKTANYLHF